MKNKRLIHTYTEPKMKLFWQSIYLLITVVGFFVATAFIIGPVVLMVIKPSGWLFLLIVFIPIGLWMNRRILRFTRKFRWQNRHLSKYQLFNDTIETTEWLAAHSTAPIKRIVPLKSIFIVAAAPYIVRQTMTDHGTNRVITKTAPILFILYTEKGENRLLNIPFPNHDDPAINVWLSHFKEQLIPIDFTARLLYRKNYKFMDDGERIEFIERSDEMVPFSFSGDWLTDYPFAWDAWNERVKERRRKEEAKNYGLKQSRLKHSMKEWFVTILIVFSLMSAFAVWLIGTGESFLTPSDTILPGVIVFTGGAFLFFYLLKSDLRWYYMIIFSLLVFLISCASFIAPETEGAMAESLWCAGMLSLAYVWMPYLVIKRVTSKWIVEKVKGIEV